MVAMLYLRLVFLYIIHQLRNMRFWKMGQSWLKWAHSVNFKIAVYFGRPGRIEIVWHAVVRCFGAIPATLSHTLASYLAMRWRRMWRQVANWRHANCIRFNRQWVLELVCHPPAAAAFQDLQEEVVFNRINRSGSRRGNRKHALELAGQTLDERKNALTFIMVHYMTGRPAGVSESVVNKSSVELLARCCRNSADGGESPACSKFADETNLIITNWVLPPASAWEYTRVQPLLALKSQVNWKLNDAKLSRGKREKCSCDSISFRHIFIFTRGDLKERHLSKNWIL